MSIHNFSPGPAMIPPSVLSEAVESLREFEHLGMSFAEMSHRHPKIMAVVEEATALMKELLALNDDFEVIWVGGGASAQLAIAPMNFTNPSDTVAFVETGFWAMRAIEAAEQICKTHILASSKDTHFDNLPKNWVLPDNVRYLHLVSNETIDGTQYHDFPEVDVPLVADMTSDLLSRPLPMHKFGAIFASAQKNFGIAGITCTIVRKDMLGKNTERTVPTIFDYRTHIAQNSLYHTIPTFPTFTSLLALRWTKEQGGLAEMQRRNAEKAAIIYGEIDRNPLFRGSVQVSDRSVMNACFRIEKPELEQVFLDFAAENGVLGIKGFPTVGGFRASMYNAMPRSSVQLLADLMHDFALKYAD